MPAEAATVPADLSGAAPVSAATLLRDVLAAPVPRAHAARPRLIERRAQALREVGSADLLQPATRWRLVPLADVPGDDGTLCFDGVQLLAPRLLPTSGSLRAVAVAVATIGPALEARVSEGFARRETGAALALDSVGNELLFALSRRLQDQVQRAARDQGLDMAGELRAGDPGLPLQAQAPLLALVGAPAIGVTLSATLSATLMMQPAKSVSMLLGLGHGLPAVAWSRCDDCRSRARCAVAQAAP